MDEAIDALAVYIATDLGIGTVGVDVFLENMPDQPDSCVMLVDSGGGPPTLTQGDNTDSPSWQIMARSRDAATCRQNLLTIYQALHGISETTLHGVHFKLLYALQSSPVPLGRDEKQRFRFTQNFRGLVAGVTR